MAEATIKIGTVGPRDTRAENVARGQADPARRFPGVYIDNMPGLGVLTQDRGPGWHNALRGIKHVYLREVPKLAKERNWDAVAVGGAPVELMNPGLHAELQELLSIPATTAMMSCLAAMKAFGAKRALLMTGFFEGLDEMLYGYYVRDGIELVWPKTKPFTDYDAGSRRMSPEVLFSMVQEGLQTYKDVDVVYFQGALNSEPILERVESELALPVVSSGLANTWYILSKLGLAFSVQGAGRLLSEWPALPQRA